MSQVVTPLNVETGHAENGVVRASEPAPRQSMNVSPDLLDLNPEQVKRHEGTEAFRCLIDSVAQHGILQPIGVKATEDGRFRVVFGNGRASAARVLKLEKVQAFVLGKETDENEAILTLIENTLRNDLSQCELWQSVARIRKQQPNLALKEIAAKLSMDASSLTRITSPERCSLDVQEALRLGKINLGHTYEIAKVDDDVAISKELFRMALGRASRDALQRKAQWMRSNPAGTVPPTKVARVKCETASGAVTIAAEGEGITLSEIIKTLTDVLREAREAEKSGLDARTFAAAMKCKKAKPKPTAE